MPNPVAHWEIVSKDAKRAQDFYAKLFDWHVEPMEGMNYGIIDTHTEAGINGDQHLLRIGPDPSADSQEMLVTVEFRDMGGSTEVVLTHEYHPDQHSRDEHAKGWAGCLTQLAALFENPGS